MLVADCRDRDRDRSPRPPPLPLVAEDQAPPDVEIAVEAEPLVDRASGGSVGAAKGDRIALDRGDVARSGVLEVTEVRTADPEPTGDPYGRILQRPDKRSDDVARRLDRGVEDQDDRAGRPSDRDVPGRSGPEPLARPDDLDPVVELGQGGLLIRRRRVRDV